jgi:hypothetical protein
VTVTNSMAGNDVSTGRQQQHPSSKQQLQFDQALTDPVWLAARAALHAAAWGLLHEAEASAGLTALLPSTPAAMVVQLLVPYFATRCDRAESSCRCIRTSIDE